ncbi:MAG: hypothetical protein ACLU6W_13585 [Lachnospiraceae bacterium]|nr:hypothetical protein [Candidatus Fimimorpha excrementavium]
MKPNATVIEDGFTVSEQTVAGAAPDVAAWLEELGYERKIFNKAAGTQSGL